MKKAIALFLSIAMMATAMVGCAKKEEPAPAPSAPAASAPAASEPAKEELPSYNFQLGINTVEDSVRGEMAHVFGDYIKEASGGRLTLEIFPNSSLGGEQEIIMPFHYTLDGQTITIAMDERESTQTFTLSGGRKQLILSQEHRKIVLEKAE